MTTLRAFCVRDGKGLKYPEVTLLGYFFLLGISASRPSVHAETGS